MKDFIFTYRYIIAGYLGLINITAFVMFGIDKRRAKRKMWRISEKALMMSAVLGGSVGGLLGMSLFRHKTKHRKFTLGIPAIFIVETAAIILLLMKNT